MVTQSLKTHRQRGALMVELIAAMALVAAAQITTSALVLLNGLIVAAVVIAVFSTLVNLINCVALW